MCGFVIAKNVKQNLEDVVEKIKHRGLSEFKGYATYDNIQLAHYSLPFVNLDPKVATQPYIYETGHPSLFVGEIFNYDSLGDYKTDMEAITDLEYRKGPDAFHDFDGFWSYATIKPGDKTFGPQIIAYTDYLCQKPLYYRTDVDVVASEIDILKEFGPVTRNEVFHSNVMKWGYDPRPETPWNEIKQIPPGHYYFEGDVHEYWDWSKVKTTDLRMDLTKAVHNRLGGEREVSLLLSGGLDSTIIYGLIKGMDRKVKVIHVDNEESEWSKLAFEYHNSEDEYIGIKLDDITDEEAIKAHQTPVDLGSVKPQLAMAKKLRDVGSYCVMSGDGADELFGGYRRAKEYDSQHSDVFMELPYYHHPRLDRIMMNQTIELRAPFLSAPVVAHALKVPYSKRNGEKKVLKDIFEFIVPKEIIDRDKKPLKTKKIAKDPMSQRIINEKIWKDTNGPNAFCI